MNEEEALRQAYPMYAAFCRDDEPLERTQEEYNDEVADNEWADRGLNE